MAKKLCTTAIALSALVKFEPWKSQVPVDTGLLIKYKKNQENVQFAHAASSVYIWTNEEFGSKTL
jgi:hypothetical protein